MKKGIIFLMIFGLQVGYLLANNNDTLYQKQIFYNAKTEIENMLNGTNPLDFEKAIFITENAYWNNEIDYKKYKIFLDLHALNIQNIAELNRKEKEQDFTATFLETEEQKRKKYNDLLYNWAIYSYFSDTTYYNYKLKNNSKLFNHKPFKYPNSDPFAKFDWKQSQVLNLLVNSSGNCYAQVNLFKIFANRFNTDAKICTAPSHIFIVHNDQKDRQHNLELGTNSFPGTGSIMTLTYTSTDAVRSGIAMRELNQKQSIALNLVYLAKAYEDKFNTKIDKFIYNCAITTLKYDPKNLNAMLLQAEYLEEKIINKNKSVKELQNDNDFIEYERLMVSLYNNGYREMPLDMKNIIVSRLRNEETGIIYKDHTPKGFTNPKLNDNRYITLSNGLFDELHAFKPMEQYGRTLLDAKNKKIKDFVKADTLYNNYPLDPVVFAWAIDPLASKYPHQSPYSAFNNNPIIYIDPDGQEGVLFVDVAGVGHAFIAVLDKNEVLTIYTYGQYGQGYDDGKSHPAGTGALVRLKGKDAFNYLNDHYAKEDKYDIRAFHLSDKLVDETKVTEYFDKIIDDPNAVPAENKNDVTYAKSKGSKAVQYDTYTGIPIPGLTENCVTVADEGLEKGGTNIIGTEWLPARLNSKLKLMDFVSKEVTEVTTEVKEAVQK